MKNIVLIFLFAFLGICYAAPPDIWQPIEKDKYAVCVNVFEPVYSPVAVEAQKFEVYHIEKRLFLPSNIGYSFYKFGFKEKYLSQPATEVPLISHLFREVNSDIFIEAKIFSTTKILPSFPRYMWQYSKRLS